MSDTWRKCSVCKDEISFEEEYFSCNVTTCNKVGRESVFCSVGCWDAHRAVMNHKDAWCEEKISPTSTNFTRSDLQSKANDLKSVAKIKETPK
jgi:hypothetical protein